MSDDPVDDPEICDRVIEARFMEKHRYKTIAKRIGVTVDEVREIIDNHVRSIIASQDPDALPDDDA